jgi:hypothetical protein
MITFLTTPENTFNDSRCIKSCKIDKLCPKEIQDTFYKTKEFNLKETANGGENCNIINLCLMIFINELGPEYISNIIKNLDNISDDIFINEMDFSALNTEILDFVNEESNKYNRNILNNVLNTKIIIKQINIKIQEYLVSHGVFAECNYTLPIKKSPGIIRNLLTKVGKIWPISLITS